MLPFLATFVQHRELARGDVLFRQGDTASAIYRVQTGRLRLERRTFDGRLLILHTARPGEFFAEASLFATAYHCDATAVEAAHVEVYPKHDVLRAVRDDPACAEGLLVVLALQLQSVRRRLELRNVRSARERVLLWLDLNAGQDRVVILDGPLQDIAFELGLTREALYRTLARLEREQAITREASRIVIKKAPSV